MRNLPAGAALLVLVACRQPASARDAFIQTDSAGVTVTDSRTPRWEPGQGWTVDSVPLLDIGSADGDEPFLLSGAESAWRTEDGGVFFANTGTQEVRFFDSAGGYVKAFGRRGGGPGEFSNYSFMAIVPTASELLVADEMNSRVNVFGLDGSFRRTVRFAIPAGRARPNLAGVAGADWVVRSSLAESEPRPGKWIQDTLQYLRYSPEGAFQGPIVSVPSQPNWRFDVGSTTRWMSIPMAGGAEVHVDSTGIIVGRTGGPELERWNADGRLMARHRWGTGERRRAKDLADQYWANWAAISDSATRKVIDAFIRSEPILPEWVATHSRIAEGPDGTVWVQHFYFDWETARRWDVLDRGGRWLGTVDMPARHWLYRAGTTHVVAWHRDSLDVEHVTVHRLRRPAATLPR